MTSTRRMFLVFIAALLGVALAMGWVTWQAVELERGERRARAEARQQESIRLSLWRMDSLLTAILARESGRPYFEFQPFYPAQRAYTRMFEPVQPGEVLVPSPLLAGGDDLVNLYFQLGPDGRLSSPQAPTGNMRDLAESAYVDPDAIINAEQRLNSLASLGLTVRLAGPDRAGQPVQLGAVLQPTTGLDPLPQTRGRAEQTQSAERAQADELLQLPEAQVAQTVEEYAARQRQAELSNRPRTSPTPPPQIAYVPGSIPSARGGGGDRAAREPGEMRAQAKDDTPPDQDLADKDTATARRQLRADEPATVAGPPGGELEQGPFHAVWIRPPGRDPHASRADPELLLIRRIELQSQELHQGLWMDWPAVRHRLLNSIADLLPQARLEPIPESQPAAPEEVGRFLATIPARLVPGPLPESPVSWWTPRRATLLLSWIAMIGAGLTVFLVLRASIALSERRGRFVSAVTHELRTPLTTFCLYSQMLADGMVTDDEARRQYLGTLKSESRRLARVVEDVLDYARLSRPKPRSAPRPIPAAELLAQSLPELRLRAQRGGLTLLEEIAPLPDARIAADPRSVERILLNLVDNACKYADGPDRRLHLRARTESGRLLIQVADHGPGIPDGDAARIFQPFERGRSTEHQSEPGLGLGLALSHGLAAALGGELKLTHEHEYGAVFTLSLPLR